MIITRITINLLFKELYLFHFEKKMVLQNILYLHLKQRLRFCTADVCRGWGVEVGPMPQ